MPLESILVLGRSYWPKTAIEMPWWAYGEAISPEEEDIQKEYIVDDLVPRPNNFVPGESDWIIVLRKKGYLKTTETTVMEGKGVAPHKD